MIPEPTIASPEPFVLPQVDKWETANGLKVEFVEVTQAGQKEARPHLLN